MERGVRATATRSPACGAAYVAPAVRPRTAWAAETPARPPAAAAPPRPPPRPGRIVRLRRW